MKVYIAAPKSAAFSAERMAASVVALGHVITSRWHSILLVTGAKTDPADEELRREILDDNTTDLERADAVIVIAHAGKPETTFSEVGHALALKKPVFWLHAANGDGRNLYDSHRLVTRVVCDVEGVGSLVQWLQNLAELGQ